MSPVRRFVRLLRSPALARAILIYLAVLCGVAAWLPWVRGVESAQAPGWAVATGMDRPFTSLWFLAGISLLFASTLACTWDKPGRLWRLWRGEVPGAALSLQARSGADPSAFLAACGFSGKGPLVFRYRFAVWGGYVLHLGLLALIAGVGVQQALHDGGLFQLVPGEKVDLAAPGTVFGREAGPLAPAQPPPIEVALEQFDPYRHQPGYAPDRFAVLSLSAPGSAPLRAELDRAAGVELAGVEIFQAVPSGLAAMIETDGEGRRALHLATHDPRTAVAEVREPSGGVARLVVVAERSLNDPMGTGALTAALERDGRATSLALGQPFSLRGETSRIVGWTRWAGFSYSRAPGMVGVFAGFLLILAGAALLALPFGVARLPEAGEPARVWLVRGAEALQLEWEKTGSEP